MISNNTMMQQSSTLLLVLVDNKQAKEQLGTIELLRCTIAMKKKARKFTNLFVAPWQIHIHSQQPAPIFPPPCNITLLSSKATLPVTLVSLPLVWEWRHLEHSKCSPTRTVTRRLHPQAQQATNKENYTDLHMYLYLIKFFPPQTWDQ